MTDRTLSFARRAWLGLALACGALALSGCSERSGDGQSAGGFSGIVMMVETEDGQQIGGGRPVEAPDLDGVPGGLQPEGEIVLPGQNQQ